MGGNNKGSSNMVNMLDAMSPGKQGSRASMGAGLSQVGKGRLNRSESGSSIVSSVAHASAN